MEPKRDSMMSEGFITLAEMLNIRPPDGALVQNEASAIEARLRAQTLREMRQRAGLTQAQLAERMCISQRRVSAIERGQISRAEVDTIRSYVAALDGAVYLVAEVGDTIVRIA